jgi:signal peptidase I
MEPTLRPGNVVLTLRHLPGLHDPIHRRALVTARDPLTGAMLVKRVVALGGDTVGIADGRLVVNGRPTREPFVDHGMVDGRYFGPLRVPPGSVFLLGDNRANSRDSREFGAIRGPGHRRGIRAAVASGSRRITPVARV